MYRTMGEQISSAPGSRLHSQAPRFAPAPVGCISHWVEMVGMWDVGYEYIGDALNVTSSRRGWRQATQLRENQLHCPGGHLLWCMHGYARQRLSLIEPSSSQPGPATNWHVKHCGEG